MQFNTESIQRLSCSDTSLSVSAAPHSDLIKRLNCQIKAETDTQSNIFPAYEGTSGVRQHLTGSVHVKADESWRNQNMQYARGVNKSV